MTTLLWMQTGACSGDTMAVLCAERPTFEELLGQQGIELLWHPSLSADRTFGQVLAAVESGATAIDILCIEGSLVTGPNGSGMYDSWKGRPKIDIVLQLAARARHVVAMGTCAAFGGIHAAPPTPATASAFNSPRVPPAGCSQLIGAAPAGSR